MSSGLRPGMRMRRKNIVIVSKAMAKIYIDTTRLIDFYRVTDDKIVQLEELQKHKRNIVLTEQTRTEFRRNRVTALKQLQAEFKKNRKKPSRRR